MQYRPRGFKSIIPHFQTPWAGVPGVLPLFNNKINPIGAKSVYYNLLPYYGGKFNMLEKLLDYIEQLAILNQAHTFIECFGGGGKCILNLDKLSYRFKCAIYNELDKSLCSLFKVVSNPDTANELIDSLSNINSDKDTFEYFKFMVRKNADELDDIGRACMMMYLCLLSYNSNQQNFKPESDEVRNRYYNKVENIRYAPDHLSGVGITNNNYKDIMKCCGQDTKVIKYLDPPYHPLCRNQNGLKIYTNELTRQQHKELIEILCDCHGWVLSGYDPAQWGCDDYKPLEAAGAVKVSLGKFIVNNRDKVYKEEFIWYKA